MKRRIMSKLRADGTDTGNRDRDRGQQQGTSPDGVRMPKQEHDAPQDRQREDDERHRDHGVHQRLDLPVAGDAA
jgi:hypothetical protein